ncbi:MAG: hypothetical protein V3W20_00555 [Candidatus Neomarinimicrobiota bacterium]
MNIIYVILITILVTLASTYLIIKSLTAIKNQFGRFISLEKRLEFHDITIQDLQDSFKSRVGLLEAVTKKYTNKTDRIEKVADNFDRDMNTYHKNINKDIVESRNSLALSFSKANESSLVKVWTRLKKIDTRLKSLEDVQLIHAHSISDLEKLDVRTFESPYAERIAQLEELQKKHGTSLFTHAEMISDLQKLKK